jgi:hypothetical protein
MSPPKMLALNTALLRGGETVKEDSGAETVLRPASHDESSVN